MRYALCSMRFALTILDSVLYSAIRNPHSALRGASFFMDDTHTRLKK